jgi:hypothetical protein
MCDEGFAGFQGNDGKPFVLQAFGVPAGPRSDIQNSRSLFKVCRKTPDHIGHVNRLGVLDVLQTMVLIEGNNSIALIEVVPRTRPEIPSADSDEGARL